MSRKISKKQDGTIVLEFIARDDVEQKDIEYELLEQGLSENNEGVFVTKESVLQPTGLHSAALYTEAIDGIGGNQDPQKKSMHGWRGTNNDIAVFAHGWRKVKSVRKRKRGKGYRVILSKDLRFNRQTSLKRLRFTAKLLKELDDYLCQNEMQYFLFLKINEFFSEENNRHQLDNQIYFKLKNDINK